MPIVEIRRIGEFEGREITLQGWLYNLRESGKILFPIFRDGTGMVQGVVARDLVDERTFEIVRNLTEESSLIVTGKVRRDARAPGGYELDVTGVKVLQAVPLSDPYPIQRKEHGPDFLLEYRHLWIRSPRQSAILRVRHEVARAIRDFFDDRGFILADAPIFTPAACEGTTTLFGLDYFDEGKAYLTQSGQLYSEATSAALGKVYCFGPTFRAEKSKTRRHLTEFWMAEPEVAFARLEDIMVLAEDLVAFIVARALERRQPELKLLERETSKLEAVKTPFPRISYDDAVSLLREKGSTMEWGGDFGGPDETLLGEQFDRPVLVHGYPAAIKAFYMAREPKRPEVSRSVDVIAPEGYGEIIGGGERESDYNLLLKRIEEQKLPGEAFKWYLDLRRYGSVPHAGFGLGLERTVAWICGIEHIREAIPFPRMIYRIYP
jgi:asparaginyl-tRNA synthetase